MILENETTLDISAMDSGVIFDHDDNISLSSVNTKEYTTKNTMAGVAYNNGKITVNGFHVARNLTTATPMDQDDVSRSPKWGDGPPP